MKHELDRLTSFLSVDMIPLSFTGLPLFLAVAFAGVHGPPGRDGRLSFTGDTYNQLFWPDTIIFHIPIKERFHSQFLFEQSTNLSEISAHFGHFPLQFIECFFNILSERKTNSIVSQSHSDRLQSITFLKKREYWFFDSEPGENCTSRITSIKSILWSFHHPVQHQIKQWSSPYSIWWSHSIDPIHHRLERELSERFSVPLLPYHMEQATE